MMPMSILRPPRIFYLIRLVDPTGISGTGIVADGTQFQDGTCVLGWATDIGSVAVYRSIDHIRKLHCHGHDSVILWEDQDFIHLPTGTPILFDCACYEPTPKGLVQFDGWPNHDYARVSKWIRKHGRTLPCRDRKGAK